MVTARGELIDVGDYLCLDLSDGVEVLHLALQFHETSDGATGHSVVCGFELLFTRGVEFRQLIERVDVGEPEWLFIYLMRVESKLNLGSALSLANP